MSFAIVAEALLGVYRGHVGAGEVDQMPSPARLHAGLLCAAAQGVRAVADGDGLQPCDADRDALRWLEENPPDGITVPDTLSNDSAAVAYRREGLIVKEGAKSLGEKLIGKPAVGGVAVNGRFAWTWEQSPPDSVVAALVELCAEVPYLGTSESPVRLSVEADWETEPTHLLDRDADLFTGRGLDLAVAATGRVDALEAAYRAAGVAPRSASDAHAVSEKTLRPPVVTAGTGIGRYVPRDPPPAPTPWASVHVLTIDRPVPPEQRVRSAVAVHRALISRIGDGAPAILTGVYESGVRQPSNRCAIHFLPESRLAVLLPREMSDVDLAMVEAAVARLREIRTSAGKLRVVGAPRVFSADQFWPEPAAGTERWWRTDPVAVPDCRPPRGGRWSLADAAALSVAFVWRDEIGAPGRGDAHYRGLAAAASERGVRVHSAVRVMDGDVGRYVHNYNKSAVIQPYRAMLSLGALTGPRTLAAIGQSRHLGGGLLMPVDLPVDIARRLAR
ncbi:type I-U CRISPR-associated protein Csb2 [Polymorphospora sp. NPDC051019]|uniref:type I-G CRISPR-associated protein Csb2 n=1 Tax=Polymorphospora sp. NPDC051019 TaxID=3155725 RepID=UPI00344AB686